MAQQLVNALVLGSIYMLFSLGLTLSWGILNVLNLAHGAIFMVGGFVAWRVTAAHSLPIYVVLPAAILVCGVIAVLLNTLVFAQIKRRYQDESSMELGILIASVGFGGVLEAIATKWTSDSIETIPTSVFPIHVYHVAGLDISNIDLLIVVFAVVLTGAIAYVVQRTRVGHALRAVAFDADTCELMGISSNRLAALTMFVSGGVAGAAGVLLSIELGSMQATMGDAFLLKAFAVIILGGVGSIGGAAAAAYLLAIVETAMLVYIDSNLTNMVAFVMIIALLLIRPQGLFSRQEWRRA